MHADTFPLRALLRTAVAILALAFATLAQAADRDTGDTSIRPFRIDIPQAQLDDLQRRLKHTRWPDKETVADASQGAQLARVQALVEHWRTRYDWRRTEARLNAYPQFVTAIDGVDIHFLHIRSPHADALPLIMTHGWPGSVIELLEVIGPLTNTTGISRLCRGGSSSSTVAGVRPLRRSWRKVGSQTRGRSPLPLRERGGGEGFEQAAAPQAASKARACARCSPSPQPSPVEGEGVLERFALQLCLRRGSVVGDQRAALSGSHRKAPGFAGGWLLPRLTAARPRMRSTWCCLRCRATASPASRLRRVGTAIASPAPGTRS
jgi:hypothetical protein